MGLFIRLGFCLTDVCGGLVLYWLLLVEGVCVVWFCSLILGLGFGQGWCVVAEFDLMIVLCDCIYVGWCGVMLWMCMLYLTVIVLSSVGCVGFRICVAGCV